MKNIIVKGKPELRKRICQCGHCGCQFDYADDDVYKNKPASFNGPVICVKCPWCLEEIKLPTFDYDINNVPQTQDADRENSAGSHEAYGSTDDYIDGRDNRLVGLKTIL